MGFSLSYVLDVLKLPWPLFPRYKNSFPYGVRIPIPAVRETFQYDIDLPIDNKYELRGVSFSASGYKDGDYYDIMKNSTYIVKHLHTKELAQEKVLHPISRFIPESDVLRFIYYNETGTSKSLWIDFNFVCQRAPNTVDTFVEPVPALGNVYSPVTYFTAISGALGYIDPNSINMAHWTPVNLGAQGTLDTNFYVDRKSVV